jgi:hypothetical protein
MKKHVMVDIETLATSNDAHIIQIGACWGFEDQIRMEDNFLVSIEERNPALYEIDDRTIEWWKKQSDEAIDSLRYNLVRTVADALDSFDAWLHELGFNKHWLIWANSPQFDLVIMRNAYDTELKCGKAPWHYRQERDVRTVWQEIDRKREIALPKGLLKHRADHDAVLQMVALLKRL